MAVLPTATVMPTVATSSPDSPTPAIQERVIGELEAGDPVLRGAVGLLHGDVDVLGGVPAGVVPGPDGPDLVPAALVGPEPAPKVAVAPAVARLVAERLVHTRRVRVIHVQDHVVGRRFPVRLMDDAVHDDPLTGLGLAGEGHAPAEVLGRFRSAAPLAFRERVGCLRGARSGATEGCQDPQEGGGEERFDTGHGASYLTVRVRESTFRRRPPCDCSDVG